ncbi:unnamed protein product, partial [Lymnaea stagnalis]
MIYRFLLVVTLLHHATPFQLYRLLIPNGEAVPHPCKPNTIWAGVGHILDAGSGERNPFGLDFLSAGKKWTDVLCRKDSDGDGMTNGQELGDPDCVWKFNEVVHRTTGLSHPGICDPWDSPLCLRKNIVSLTYRSQGDWLRAACAPGPFQCDELNKTDYREVSMKLPPGTPVSQNVISYQCQIFDLESMITPGDYHVIAIEPVVDHSEALLHMMLFGCRDDQTARTQPFQCDLVASSACQDVLSVWTIARAGDCLRPYVGLRVGANGYKRLAVQYQWTNPERRANWTDSSGLKLYYTSQRRLFDAGVFVTGSDYFVLPRQRDSIAVTSTCTGGCTRDSFLGPIWVTMATNRMHYAGTKMNMQVYRNNTLVARLTDSPIFRYDSPQFNLYTDNPILLLPEDKIVTTCTYSTVGRNSSTDYGLGETDEVCNGYLTFFPKQNIARDRCLSGGPDLSSCDWSVWASQGCISPWVYYNASALQSTTGYSDITANCRPFGPCLEECVNALVPLITSNGCLQGDVYQYLQATALTSFNIGTEMAARIASCNVEVYVIVRNSAPPTVVSTLKTTMGYNGTTLTTTRAGGQSLSSSRLPSSTTASININQTSTEKTNVFISSTLKVNQTKSTVTSANQNTTSITPPNQTTTSITPINQTTTSITPINQTTTSITPINQNTT